MVVILGAGLAGLSTAYHLGRSECLLIEREDQVGGLCRTFERNGFFFDCTGHLLHFRKNSIRKLVESLIGDGLRSHSRRSYIFSKGIYTDYPFQANTYGLPKEVVKKCLLDFIEAYIKGTNRQPSSKRPRNLHDWILQTFGEGISRHFMIPFNEKLWQCSLRSLSADWGGGWLIPRPSLEEVVGGALGIPNRTMGYNPTFLYPEKGGIQVLPQAFVPHVGRIRLKTEVKEIHLARRRVILSNGPEMPFEYLVSTIPLPELIRRCVDVPSYVRTAASRLKYVSVYNVNIGVKRENVSKAHWIYLPEKKFPFYRIGFPMNFSPYLVPPECSSIYVEISHQPGRREGSDHLLDTVIQGLIELGVLYPDDPVAMSEVRDIPYAYVIFNQDRLRAIRVLQNFLEKNRVYSIGRYGAWEHTSMEDAIWHGQEAAQKIASEAGKSKS